MSTQVTVLTSETDVDLSQIPNSNLLTLSPESILGVFGDSMIASGYDINNGRVYQDVGFAIWSQILSGSRFYQPSGNNKTGVGGNTTLQMIQRLQPALDLKAKAVIVMGGTNDPLTDANYTIINLQKIYKAFIANGAVVIPCTVLYADFMSSGQKAVVDTINAWILSQKSEYIRPVDTAPLLTDFSLLIDGTHPNKALAYAMGNAVAVELNKILSEFNVADLLHVDNSYNTNLFLTGTTGSMDSGNGTQSGQIATGWRGAINNTTSGPTVAWSKGTDNNLNQQILTISDNYTGNDGQIAFYQNYTPTDGLLGTDTVEGIIDFEIISDITNITTITMSVTLDTIEATSGVYSLVAINQNQSPFTVGRYQMRTPPWTQGGSAVTNVQTNLFINFMDAAGSTSISGQLKIHKIGIKKVSVNNNKLTYSLTPGLGLSGNKFDNTGNQTWNNTLLVGVSSGQTIIGGKNATDKLVLQGTSASGTPTSAAIQFKVGNSGDTIVQTILNNGWIGFGSGNTNPNAPFSVNGRFISGFGSAVFNSSDIAVLAVNSSNGNSSGVYLNEGGNPFWKLINNDGDANKFYLTSSSFSDNPRLIVTQDGNFGYGITNPTGIIHIKSGTTAASTSPLKFTSGVSGQTSLEQGAVNWNGSRLFIGSKITTASTVNQSIAYLSDIDISSTGGTFVGNINTVNILPSLNTSYNIGSASLKFLTAFLGTTQTGYIKFGGLDLNVVNNSSTAVGTWFSTGNLLIQSGGTQVDNGYRLDVSGTSRFTGNVTLSGSNSTAITQLANDNSKKIATTEFTQIAVSTKQTNLGIINVKDFGTVGDGVTDDRNAIINAIASAPSLGATIFFPSGQYLLSSGITIPHHVSLQGVPVMRYTITDGSFSYEAGSVIVVNNATGFTAIEIDSSSLPDVDSAGSIIQNLHFWDKYNHKSKLLYINTVNHCRIYNCGFFMGATGFELNAGIEDASWAELGGNIFVGNTLGFLNNNISGVTVPATHLYGGTFIVPANGVGIRNVNAKYVRIHDLKMDINTGSKGIHWLKGSAGAITNVQMEMNSDSSTIGIHIDPTIQVGGAGDITIVNAGLSSNNGLGTGIKISGGPSTSFPTKGIQIIGGNFTGLASGIWIQSGVTAANINSIDVSNCTTGIQLDASSYNHLVSNITSNVDAPDAIINNSTGSIFKNYSAVDGGDRWIYETLFSASSFEPIKQLLVSNIDNSFSGSTTETSVYSGIIPAGSIGNNGSIDIEIFGSASLNNANVKVLNVYLNGIEGEAVGQLPLTSGLSATAKMSVRWRNSSTQVTHPPIGTTPGNGYGISTASFVSNGFVDNTEDITVDVFVKLATSSDMVTLKSIRVLGIN